MSTKRRIDETVFLDASYLIALANPKDRYHPAAVELADELLHQGATMITTLGVILEVGNALSAARYRNAARDIVSAMLTDPLVRLVPLTDDLCGRAVDLYANRRDKEWGLTDCCSFIAMQDAGITQALSADRHFVQAGFEALLLAE